MTRVCALLLAAITFMFGCALMPQKSALKITHVPTWHSDENLTGRVRGLDLAEHHLVVALHVQGVGWWTKASWETPNLINPDGTFEVDVTTGGRDVEAIGYWVAIVPNSVEEMTLRGESVLPMIYTEVAILGEEITREIPEGWEPVMETLENRVIDFAGYQWGIKGSNGPVGPGDNWFSDDKRDIWVDAEGLHLTLREREGRWWCTEAVLSESLGYGTYVIHTASRVDIYDPEIVAGLFTWDTAADWFPGGSADRWPFREFDIEFSRWGDPDLETNAHFAVQPWDVEGNHQRFTVPDLSDDPRFTGIWTWRPGEIEFLAAVGHHNLGEVPEESILCRWTYVQDPEKDHWVPDEGNERLRFNLWLNTVSMGRGDTNAPRNGESVELLISDFQFTPLD